MKVEYKKLLIIVIVFAILFSVLTYINAGNFSLYQLRNIEALTDSETYRLVDCIIENNDNFDPRYDIHCIRGTSDNYIYDCEYDFYTLSENLGKCVSDKY